MLHLKRQVRRIATHCSFAKHSPRHSLTAATGQQSVVLWLAFRSGGQLVIKPVAEQVTSRPQGPAAQLMLNMSALALVLKPAHRQHILTAQIATRVAAEVAQVLVLRAAARMRSPTAANYTSKLAQRLPVQQALLKARALVLAQTEQQRRSNRDRTL